MKRRYMGFFYMPPKASRRVGFLGKVRLVP